MSANVKPSKFQGLFKQAAESPLPANEPVDRIERDEQLDSMVSSQITSRQGHPTPISETTKPSHDGGGQGGAPSSERRQPGRPAGKRTNKDWKQFSVLLRHEDQFQAVSILRSTRDKRDFSMLMQGLLEGWLKKQGARK